MTVTYEGGAEVNEDILVRDIIKTISVTGTRPRFKAGSEKTSGYSWYTPALGAVQVHINQDTGFADQNYRVLGDSEKRELVQVYIDVFCPANKMRQITRAIDAKLWDANKVRPVQGVLSEFEETDVYWITEQKRDIKDQIAHCSGTITCVLYKTRT